VNKWILGVGLAAAIVFWASLNAFSATEYDGLFGDTTFDIGPWQMELLPDKQPYPSYVADPRRPRMHFGVGAISNEVPERSGGIITLDAGTRITLLKMQRGMYIPRL
jgi:hypothetical protein